MEGEEGNSASSSSHLPALEPPLNRPQWFTPRRLLAIFCVIHILNYIDRGAIASNGVNGKRRTCNDAGVCNSGSGIQGDFKLNYFQDGVLSSAFMVGLLLASPIFASLAKTHNPFRLIAVGMSVWTIAVAGCGFSFNFWFITVCRMLVGVGEASFISLAAPYIDDNAPDTQRAAWLAVFYMCIPAGIAFGYVYGGVVGSHLGWRYAFWGEAILMLPLVVFGFVAKPLQLKGFASSRPKIGEPIPVEGVKNSEMTNHVTVESGRLNGVVSRPKFSKKLRIQISRFFIDMKALLLERVFVVNVLGYIAYNFVIGAYSYWGPKAGYNIYHMNNADMIFGGITIISGIVGTLAGGYILDRMHSSISNAFKLLSGASFLGAVFCFGGFCSKNLYIFLALFAIGELCLFATQGPVNYVCLHCVEPSLRALSMAMSTVAIHIFGDVPSSPLVGVLQDNINNWRKTALILTSIFFLASVIWFAGIFLHSVDRFSEETEHVIVLDGRSNAGAIVNDNRVDRTESV